ncbi:MAG TPA: DUF4149 domain-containing protein [Nitrospirota bacterium]
MKLSWFSIYTIILALWIGGIAIFTFIVTPVIFKSYPRDTASEIVGKIFPLYFLYNLFLAALAMVLFFLVPGDRSNAAYHLSRILVAVAVFINVFITFKLYPAAVRAKQEVTSFQRESPDSAARKKFTRLHALSATLNLLLLADGIALLLASPSLKK